MLALDIQLEIIKRLPVKSLIQFRSVCKAWKSFIDSSQFIAGYSVPHTQPQHLLIKYEVEDPQITEFMNLAQSTQSKVNGFVGST
ncbi:hypothetical protein L6452_08283 [Arctium lappa]|uniref:Uncharacterized protein n=1 Tax=Arctium lappa TaxID=4217 RepID=A0ACB9DHV5_ARCLA|nr:hypothetical protein L6452_08283 [Arctium lappa]